jgi:hypothetical protein
MLTIKESFWGSNLMLATLFCYLGVAWTHLVVFTHIHDFDEIIYLHFRDREKTNQTITFKKRQFYVVMFSKKKNEVYKQTYILNIIEYFLLVFTIISFMISFFFSLLLAVILLAVNWLIISAYGIILSSKVSRLKKLLMAK